MNFAMAQQILGIMLMIFSLTMLPPIGVSFLYADGHWQPFLAASLRHEGRLAAKVMVVPRVGARTEGES